MMDNSLTNLMGSRILITGGLGFIGSSIAHAVVEVAESVTLYDACIDPFGWNKANIKGIENKIHFVKGDVRDKGLLAKYVSGKTHIFHCAGQVGRLISMNDPVYDLEVNGIGMLNLLEAVRKINPEARVVYTGSRGQVGESKYLPVNETHPDKPTDNYGISKLVAEKYLLLYNKVYGIHTVSLRLNNAYGPRGQMKHGHYGVLNLFIRKAMLGEEIPVFGDGSQIRDYVYIDDIVSAIILSAVKDKASGEIFYVGSGKETKFLDMVNCVIKEVGSGIYVHQPFPDDLAKIDIKRFYVTCKKIEDLLEWKNQTNLKDGICKTVKFYKGRLNEYV